MKKILLAVAVAAMATLACGVAHAQMPLPMANAPEDVGLSSAQLKKLEAVTKGGS